MVDISAWMDKFLQGLTDTFADRQVYKPAGGIGRTGFFPGKMIITTFSHLKNGGEVDFKTMAEDLFAWSGYWINNLAQEAVE